MIPIETRNGFPFPIQSALYCRWPRKHEIDIDERFRNRRIHFSGANTTLQAARLERLPSGSVQEENRSGGVSEENSRARTVRRRKRERALLVVATLSLSLLLIFQRHIPISCAQFGSRWVCIRTAPHTHPLISGQTLPFKSTAHPLCPMFRVTYLSSQCSPLSLSFLLAPVSDWWLLLFNDVRPIASDCWTRNVPVSWKSNYRRERERGCCM